AYLTGRSANRGGCTQPCRWTYVLEEQSRPGMYLPIIEDDKGTAILSSHDLCAVEFLDRLREAGVDSFKIEGRMKSEYYVATVVNAYRAAMDGLMDVREAKAELDSINHRPYSTGFYFSELKYGHDNRGEYLADCIYAGYVLGRENGLIRIEQHGTFSLGDELELLSPGKGVRRFRVEQLFDSEGRPGDRANRSGLAYTLNCPHETGAGDILRVRAPKEGSHTETLNRGSFHKNA
ncbi:MAG: U32 family peptidase C-terminal domain-containing protein, partial [Eubacteriales bacterium]|nr:U32 family peptidase C-terminal domain-containing protein [Eubacteriales bacterium]